MGASFQAQATGESFEASTRVLVYVDGSDASTRAVDRAVALAAGGAKVTALVVVPPRLNRAAVSQFEIEEEDLDERFAQEVMTRATERIEEAGQQVAPLIVRGPVVEAIVEHGRSGEFDVVLVGRKPGERYVTDLTDTLRRKRGVPIDVVE
jgi:nucleotide-binding universal stress UspA family protein